MEKRGPPQAKSSALLPPLLPEPELLVCQVKMGDYSIWDHSPVSYKDEMHPNSDMTSLFLWQHQAQAEHVDQFQRKEELVRGCYECKNKVAKGVGGGRRWPGRPGATAG